MFASEKLGRVFQISERIHRIALTAIIRVFKPSPPPPLTPPSLLSLYKRAIELKFVRFLFSLGEYVCFISSIYFMKD